MLQVQVWQAVRTFNKESRNVFMASRRWLGKMLFTIGIFSFLFVGLFQVAWFKVPV
jgi:hypothetical protein